MLGFLAHLLRGLPAFLFAMAALLRLYVSSNSVPIPAIPLTLMGWSVAAFLLASPALLAEIGLEWNRRNRDRAGQAQASGRAAEGQPVADGSGA